MSHFHATKQDVANRGVAPDAFLNPLVQWGRTAPEEIFAPNNNCDIYSLVCSTLGMPAKPYWNGIVHRKAAMMEVMRVHAGFEASWNFNEGVDVTNASSLRDRNKRETGVYQVSYNSLQLDKDGSLRACLEKYGASEREDFIAKMKTDHALTFEYYARLVRQNIEWAGPLLDSRFDREISHPAKILPWLKRDAVAEFESLLIETLVTA